MSSSTFIALLRGINVGGRNRVPMAELRSLCAEDLGWEGVTTYIQSGNVLFRKEDAAPTLEDAFEEAIERRFGLSIPILVRTASTWSTLVASNPFEEASAREPNRVMLALSKRPPGDDVVGALEERARDGERIALSGEALWIHFQGGAGRSKLSPALLDRAAGSAVTLRNWRTVVKLEEMAKVVQAG